MAEIAEGVEFSTFCLLSAAITRFQDATFCQFYTRDSRTVEADVRRNTKKKYADAIKYANITYACIHGGRQFRSASKGLRPQQRYDILRALILYTNVLPTICMDTLCVERGMHIVYTPIAMYNKGQCVTPDVLI